MPGAEPLHLTQAYPQIHDRTSHTSFDAHYLYQAAWASGLVADRHPALHVDVGSDVRFVSVLSAFTRLLFVDLRPLGAHIADMQEVTASILHLPFGDASLASLSCLHVAEHVGLGRYGDPLDPNGTRRAVYELARVLKPGGNLYFSVPVGRDRVQFNAHRIHSPSRVLELFRGLELVSFSAVDDNGGFVTDCDPRTFDGADYACGLFWLRRPREANAGSEPS
jgi:SAM-dependent methyltransferase